ncbi:MAG: hypothetical protein QXS99_03970, partial [Thermoplasmata archaeon]
SSAVPLSPCRRSAFPPTAITTLSIFSPYKIWEMYLKYLKNPKIKNENKIYQIILYTLYEHFN